MRSREEREREAAKREHEREALASQMLRRMEEEKRKEHQQDRRREALVQEALKRRWTDLRASALRMREATRQAEFIVFEERNERCRERALVRQQERRTEAVALARRLDQRVLVRERRIQASKLQRAERRRSDIDE